MADQVELNSKSRKVKSSTLHLTKNDKKILGQNTERKKEVVASQEKFSTNKMRTYNSAWTPVVHKPSNEMIFHERRDLISHWFDLWSDSQRKRFFDVVFQQCRRNQYKFVQQWFQERVPLQHLDFTTVLPRFLSVYIFSFLEPQSLCRAGQACWHWRFLTAQDEIWMPKCLKYGWILPYKPPKNEYSAWKNHYVACIHTQGYIPANDLHSIGGLGGHPTLSVLSTKKTKSAPRSGRLSPTTSRRNMDVRPPWSGVSQKPKDLEKSFYAFLHGFNPNDPNIPKSALILHNKWGIPKKQHEQALSRSEDFELGLDSHKRKKSHRVLTSGEDCDLKRLSQRTSLRDTMELENMEERRVKQLVDTEWYPPNRTRIQKPDMTKGVFPYNINQTESDIKGQLQVEKPRVIFISSRVPAADLLVDAVLFGVIPVVYEYEGTTTETLLLKLEKALQGRQAQSIGLFCHSQEPGELRLVQNCTVTLDTLDSTNVSQFFETVADRIIPPNKGGQLDVFVPLAASEPGMEILTQLSVSTGMHLSSPTGIIGYYNHVNSDWLLTYKEGPPPSMYFCTSKLDVWSNTADQAKEALTTCKKLLSPYFEKTHKDIVSQLTGQVMFDVLGQTEIQGANKIADVLTEGLRSLGSEDNVNPLEFLGKFLLQRAGVDDLSFTSSLEKSRTMKRPPVDRYESVDSSAGDDDVDLEDSEVEQINGHTKEETAFGEEDEVGEEEELKEETSPREMREKAQNEQSEKAQQRQKKKGRKEQTTKKGQMTQQMKDFKVRFGTMTLTGKHERLTAKKFSEYPEKRTPVAMEILSSEVEYNRILKGIKDTYVKPLKAALSSDRAIASFQNVQIIFTDLMYILDVSSEMVDDLKNRLADWDATNTCLGDIFVRFCTHLKVYTNFVNNYDVILQCIERTKEQTPAFRAFLHRHERIPETRRMTLQELMLLPPRRIEQYAFLLNWFEMHTPTQHQDRADLADAIKTIGTLNRHIQQTKLRLERDRTMITLQKSILNSPSLLESNRYLIKQLDVANLRPPAKTMVPELRVYQQFEELGLFLFNDALVITRRTSRHFPFTRAVEHTYRFETSLSLARLKVIGLDNTKYIQNGFKMETPNKELFCCTSCEEDKFNWITLLEQAIRTALEG
ncbi:epithelial cell-transforming sequence 2 oncogene-like isoform X1 [Mizuhopecten yessoensis]|uniref:Epithelial cell-transforming sequence 2 oncogene-like n=1 Tax=Mizuhopecten yessoensis TaxID=6573 RepID=A0A210QQF5_MIZYE|nr:epithelial cell-transforming sequence 2 oncogene-like isoform X1 [Mizuhopecten yessoensis]OWF50928.1 Epithelial cell-transforming sequence 2 oncogene-like [Mizuhopecten yessoensis]